LHIARQAGSTVKTGQGNPALMVCILRFPLNAVNF